MAAPIASKDLNRTALPSDVLIHVLTHSTPAEATVFMRTNRAFRVSVREWDDAWLGMSHQVVLIADSGAPAMKALRVSPFEQLRARYLVDADKWARGMAYLSEQDRAEVLQDGDAANKYRHFLRYVGVEGLQHLILDEDILRDLLAPDAIVLNKDIRLILMAALRGRQLKIIALLLARPGAMAALRPRELRSALKFAAIRSDAALVRHILAHHQLMSDQNLSAAFTAYATHLLEQWPEPRTKAQAEIVEAFMTQHGRLSDEAINQAWRLASPSLCPSGPGAPASSIDFIRRMTPAILPTAPRIPAHVVAGHAREALRDNAATTALLMSNDLVRASMTPGNLAECLQIAISKKDVGYIDYFLPLVAAQDEPHETTVGALMSALNYSIETGNGAMRVQVRTRLRNLVIAHPAFAHSVVRQTAERQVLPVAFMQELAAIVGQELPLFLKNLLDISSAHIPWVAVTTLTVRYREMFRILPLIEPADKRTLLLHAATLHPFLAKALLQNMNDVDFLSAFFIKELQVPANKEKAELLFKLLLELND